MESFESYNIFYSFNYGIRIFCCFFKAVGLQWLPAYAKCLQKIFFLFFFNLADLPLIPAPCCWCDSREMRTLGFVPPPNAEENKIVLLAPYCRLSNEKREKTNCCCCCPCLAFSQFPEIDMFVSGHLWKVRRPTAKGRRGDWVGTFFAKIFYDSSCRLYCLLVSRRSSPFKLSFPPRRCFRCTLHSFY